MPPQNIRKSKAKAKPKAKAPARDEAFDRARKRLDKQRARRKSKTQYAHYWNLCPKCGGDMFEQKALGIYFEVCRECHGIHVDVAELDLARAHLDSKKLLLAISRKAKNPKTEV